MIALLIPVLGRPQNAQPLVDSIHANTRTEHNIVFLASRGDDDQIEACRRTNAITVLVEGGDCEYARKINEGCTIDYWGTPPEWVFLGADDLDFHDGWDLEAIAEHERTGKPVIGTNDCANPTVMAGRHSTHTLVHRSYIERGSIDDAAKLLHDGYSHNWVDNEFIDTARFRDAFSFAAESHVAHRHPIWHTAPDDDVYAKGRAGFHKDRRLYLSRRRLWTPARS